MSSFPISPKLVKGDLVVLHAASGGTGGGALAETMRLAGPPEESFKLEAMLDATDQM